MFVCFDAGVFLFLALRFDLRHAVLRGRFGSFALYFVALAVVWQSLLLLPSLGVRRLYLPLLCRRLAFVARLIACVDLADTSAVDSYGA